MNQLRIIAGTLGGRLIKTPPTSATHPMGDRERSAIFNMLQHDIKDASVLDAFAGSGAIGIEALSRGAKSVVFLENDKKASRTVKENVDKLNLAGQSELIKSIAEDKHKHDIIFADPPYDNPQYALILKLINKLKPGAIFVLSHPKTAQPPTFKTLMLIADKTYAAANIKIYRNLK